jgi:N-acetylglucosamine-6-sulfatase
VHHRWLPPPDLEDLYSDEKPPFPPEFNPLVFFTNGALYEGLIGDPAELYRDYARVVTAMDREIGRLLQTIDDIGEADNTVIVFASDNGFFFGEHKLGGTGRWPYEESIRVPFIVKAPHQVKNPGRIAEQMVLNVDLAPSLLDLAGLEVPGQMQGQSFKSLLQSAAAPWRKAFLHEYFKDFPFRTPGYKAVRTKDYMYVEFEGRRGIELYDLRADPRQINNLAASAEGEALQPALQQQLQVLLADPNAAMDA